MGDINQNIRVRVDAVLNGLPLFQQLGALLEKIRTSSETKIQVGDAAAIAQTSQLADSVDNLGKKIDSLKPSKIQELSTIIQGVAAGSTLLKNIGNDLGGLSNGLSFLKGKASEFVEGVGARAAPIIDAIKSKAAGLASVLPELGEGAGEAAIGVGALVAGSGVAIGTVALLAAGAVALIAAVAAVTTGLIASVPALINYSSGFADARVRIDDIKKGLIDSLPAHDKYRQLLIDEREATDAAARPARELQGLLFQLRSQWNQLTNSAGGFVDEIAQHVIPILNELLRVASHVFDEILQLVGGLDGVLKGFFDFILFNIDTIGRALVWLETRAVATAKGILAAIAIGFATGNLGAAADAFGDTFKQTVADLDKISKSNGSDSLGGGPAGKSASTDRQRGGGGRRAGKVEDTSQSEFELERAKIDAKINLIKDGLDRENKLVQERYDQRKITIADYYARELEIQDAAIGIEITRTQALLKQEEEKLRNANAKIDQDQKAGSIDDAQAKAKKQNELNKTLAASAALQEKLLTLQKDREDLPNQLDQKEKADTDALNASLQQQIDAIDSLRGLGPLVQARQQIGEIDKLIEQFKDNPGMVALLEEWREVVGAIGQAEAAVTRYQKAQELTEAKIATLQEAGNRNILAQFINAEKIRKLRQQELKDLQAMLKTLEAIAQVSNSPEIQVKIQQTKTKVEELTNETKSFKDTFKDTFIDSVATGMENFITSLGDVIAHTKTLGQAFKEMALSIIQSLEQIIAKMLVMLILKKLLGLFGGGDSSLGGSDLFGSISGGDGAAAGDFFTARAGGRIIRVAEGGHDEVVLSTDPRHRGRTQNLLATFLNRTKLFDGFDLGGWISAITHPQFDIPAFDAGGWIGSGPAFAGAGPQIGKVEFHQHLPNVRDHRDFKLNKAAIERDGSRMVRSGLNRFRKG